ncbi:MAG TPA: TolC family protein [Labilithrix sp.]|nr:TolC family protein [Labilithrix sp.]
MSALAFATPAAYAGPLDLDDDDDDEPVQSTSASPASSVAPPAPIATIPAHLYSLQECLLLAERNAPQLWAARARLAAVRGQLEEARWTPYSHWSMSSTVGYLPPIGGTAFYNSSPYAALYQGGFGDGWQPSFGLSVRGTLPLFTFGKIESVRRAAEGRVRVNEWDLEKQRQLIRMDVRRAYFGLMLARDMQYIANDVLGKLNKAISNITAKLERADASVEDVDRIRLEYNRDEILARVAEAKKGEAFAIAALRFLTGVQTAFEVPDEPLRRPDTNIGPVVRYLTAARLFRADVNMARAGVAARKAWLDFRRAELYPNIGIGLGANYSISPSVDPQVSALTSDFGNRFGYSLGIGLEWGLDLLPKHARVMQAESELEEARALERLALGGVGVEVENAYAAVVEAKSREENYDRAEHRSKRWISITQDAIDLGTKDERFLIEPLRAFVFARANHAQSLMDLHVTLSELARVTGWDAIAPTT